MDAFLLGGPFDRQLVTLEDHLAARLVRIDGEGAEHVYVRRAGEANRIQAEPVTLHTAWYVHASLSEAQGEEAVAQCQREQAA